MTVLGIDSSSQRTGMCLMSENGCEEHILIDKSKNKDSVSRTKEMVYEILSNIAYYNPDFVYVEDTWQNINPKTQKLLEKIVGAIYGYCVEHDIECVEILPGTWRKALGWKTGKLSREELKKMSLKEAAEKYGIITSSDDLADSINIAAAGLILRGGN